LTLTVGFSDKVGLSDLLLYTGTKAFENEHELWEGITRIGKAITKENVAPYIESIPSRFQKVVEKKGGYVQEK
jgi:hypothetical protein